jgi:hypothetical protein
MHIRQNASTTRAHPAWRIERTQIEPVLVKPDIIQRVNGRQTAAQSTAADRIQHESQLFGGYKPRLSSESAFRKSLLLLVALTILRSRLETLFT